MTYLRNGIEEVDLSTNYYSFLHKVHYCTTVLSHADQMIECIRDRQRKGENHYHALFNNSHHLVTFAITRNEEPLQDIIRGENSIIIDCCTT